MSEYIFHREDLVPQKSRTVILILLLTNLYVLMMDFAYNIGAKYDPCVPPSGCFEVDLSQLKSILEEDDIKDRNVVAVSIAGAMLSGKRFLLNFFSKYLFDEQCKRNDIIDWMVNAASERYHWQSGQRHKNIELGMWPDTFTHNLEKGDQVAIMLLDDQGIFDNRTTLKTSSSIFALNKMPSSDQSSNTMRTHKDNLQHLQVVIELRILASKCLLRTRIGNIHFIHLETTVTQRNRFVCDRREFVHYVSKFWQQVRILYKVTVGVMDSIPVNKCRSWDYKCRNFCIAAKGKKSAAKSPYSTDVFLNIHELFRTPATEMFQKNIKLDSEEKQPRLDDGIEKKFRSFNQGNYKKLKIQVVKWTVIIAVVLGEIIWSKFGHTSSRINSWLDALPSLVSDRKMK